MNTPLKSLTQRLGTFSFLLSILFLSGSLCPSTAKAQLLDSLDKHIRKVPGLSVKLDSRNTFFKNDLAAFQSIKIGLSYNRRFRFGGGYSRLVNPIYDITTTQKENYTLIRINKLNFSYGLAYVEYVFFRKGKWEFSMPVNLGVGKNYYRTKYAYIKDATGTVRPISESPYSSERIKEGYILLYEPTLSGQYKIVKWFAVGADLGFRYSIINNREIKSPFQSPIYVFKTIIYWDEIAKKAFPNAKWVKWL